MKELLKKTALLSAVGFALGVLVGIVLLLPFGVQTVLSARGMGWYIAYTLITGGLGLVSMGSMTLYGIERWSITRATLTHFCVTFAAFCGLGLWLGWLDLRNPFALLMIAAFLVAYFIIWLVMYLSYKRQVRRINEELKHWKDAQGKR